MTETAQPSSRKTLDDIPEDSIRIALDYMAAAVQIAPSKTASRIARILADECLLAGAATTSHKDLERQTGTCRRTVQRAICTLLARQLIERIDRVDGRSKYVCLWERGAEWRHAREARLNG